MAYKYDHLREKAITQPCEKNPISKDRLNPLNY
jgi:hypothetical protein